MIVYTDSGKALELAEPALGGGGEGDVYLIKGYKRVAKIYKDAADADSRREKIEAMASFCGRVNGLRELDNVAWPLAALYADPSAKTFVGFGMRRIESDYRLDELYNYPPPSSMRMRMEDKVDYLIDLSSIVDALHSLGQVIGDFNNNNLPVIGGGRKAALVDADSFHTRVGGKVYRCEFCMSGYVAPEVIKNVRGTTYKDCQKETFTINSDNWSLAVHVFRMLFNGIHPYHCQAIPGPTGSLPAPLPQDKRVERGETPFFKNVPGVKAPPYAPEVSAFPDYVVGLFKRAFIDGHSDPSKRPTAAEWKKVLAKYKSELKRCPNEVTHAFHKGAGTCPYCKADGKSVQVATAMVVRPTFHQPGGAGTVPAGTAAAVTNTYIPVRMGRVKFVLLTLALAVSVWALISATPVLSTALTWIIGTYSDWMCLPFLAAALGATGYFDYQCVHTDSVLLLVLAVLASVGGMAALLIGMVVVAFVIELIKVLLTIVGYLLLGAIIIGIIASIGS